MRAAAGHPASKRFGRNRGREGRKQDVWRGRQRQLGGAVRAEWQQGSARRSREERGICRQRRTRRGAPWQLRPGGRVPVAAAAEGFAEDAVYSEGAREFPREADAPLLAGVRMRAGRGWGSGRWRWGRGNWAGHGLLRP